MHILALALSLLLSAVPQPFRYTNPVLHMDFSDPDVCRSGGDYYMTASSFHCFPGLPVLHSRDLVHWEEIGAALTDYPGAGFAATPAEREAFRGRVRAGDGVWAPAIRFHDGWFYIFCGDPDRGIFMVRTQDPAGPWTEPVWLVREKGFIDPCPLWDADGRAYLSHAAAGSRAGLKSVLFMAEMAPDGSRLLGPSRIVYDGHMTQPTIEGTKLYRRDGWYYIFAPAGGVATGWQTVLRARSPWGPFEERVVLASAAVAGGRVPASATPSADAGDGSVPDVDLLPVSDINGPHQGAWVETPSGDWFLHFQDKGAYGRIVHLQPMRWTDDGWPVIGADPDGDGTGAPVAAAPLPVAAPDGSPLAPSSSPGRRLAFAGSDGQPVAGLGPAASPLQPATYGLPVGWQYPCIPSHYWHSVRPDGGIRLYSVLRDPQAEDLRDCPNLLMRKFFTERFIVTARLSFRPNAARKDRGETAGFVVMGTEYAGLRLTDMPDGAHLERFTGPDGGETVPLTVLPYRFDAVEASHASKNVPAVRYAEIPEARVWVRLDVRATPEEGNVPAAQCRFSYSLDGVNYVRAGETFVAKEGKWIGARYGFFCSRPSEKNDGGWLDILDYEEAAQFFPLEGFRYEEADVPSFRLPDPLVTEAGSPVKDVRTWERLRRPELLELFEREMFGRVPVERPEGFHFRVLSSDPTAFGGLATRKEVSIFLTADERASIRLLLYVPNRRSGPAPAFLGPNFFGNHTTTDDSAVTLGDTLRYGTNLVFYPRGYHARRWPYEDILKRGYAVATFCCADVDPDYDDGFRNGVHGLFDGQDGRQGGRLGDGLSGGKSGGLSGGVSDGQGDRQSGGQFGRKGGGPRQGTWQGVPEGGRERGTEGARQGVSEEARQGAPEGAWQGGRFRDPSAWATIAAWAWGLSRALDYLEADPDVAGDRVAVIGHSRLGKTAIWAGARDTRFAMVISNNSGCGGAALSRRGFGETLRRINTHFPHWFCARFHAYNDNEDRLPFDQHELLALVAPRPLYVASATEDLWSDPRGEYLSLLAAAPVYALYGLDALRGPETPGGASAVNRQVVPGSAGPEMSGGGSAVTGQGTPGGSSAMSGTGALGSASVVSRKNALGSSSPEMPGGGSAVGGSKMPGSANAVGGQAAPGALGVISFAEPQPSVSSSAAPAGPPCCTGYHIRPGKHDIVLYDWERYLDFADRWLRRP